MKVTLINYTTEAVETLIFTKQTRLTMTPGLFDEIRAWPWEKKLKELEYMAETIPSSWEFVDYTFLVELVSRAYTHQQVRTRAASYAQQSMRVNNMAEFDYVFTERNLADENAVMAINKHNAATGELYKELLAMGQPIEDARGILPTNIATNIVCKFNLRTFSELTASRTGGRTQSEYQKVVNAMVDAVLQVHPWATKFLFRQGRDYFNELEQFAANLEGRLTTISYPNLGREFKIELLKIIDHMRKEK